MLQDKRTHVLLAFALSTSLLAGCTPCRLDSDCDDGQVCSAGACHVPVRACEPAATLACSCPDGAQSTRTCASDGSGFSDCVCGRDLSTTCTPETCALMPDLVG